MKNKFGTPILKTKSKIQEITEEENRELKNDKNHKTYSNDMDKNICTIV